VQPERVTADPVRGPGLILHLLEHLFDFGNADRLLIGPLKPSERVHLSACDLVTRDGVRLSMERAHVFGEGYGKSTNATFEVSDMLHAHHRGYDAIALIECFYYLKPEEQHELLARIAKRHQGLVLFSGPISGTPYFNEVDLKVTFRHHGLRLIEARNLSVDHTTASPAFVDSSHQAGRGVVYARCSAAHLIWLRLYVLRTGSES
jgi:hypothetical protein